MDKYMRPSWDEYFMEVANSIAKRATCDRGRSGCVIARDNQVLATGYVGCAGGPAPLRRSPATSSSRPSTRTAR